MAVQIQVAATRPERRTSALATTSRSRCRPTGRAIGKAILVSENDAGCLYLASPGRPTTFRLRVGVDSILTDRLFNYGAGHRFRDLPQHDDDLLRGRRSRLNTNGSASDDDDRRELPVAAVVSRCSARCCSTSRPPSRSPRSCGPTRRSTSASARLATITLRADLVSVYFGRVGGPARRRELQRHRADDHARRRERQHRRGVYLLGQRCSSLRHRDHRPRGRVPDRRRALRDADPRRRERR